MSWKHHSPFNGTIPGYKPLKANQTNKQIPVKNQFKQRLGALQSTHASSIPQRYHTTIGHQSLICILCLFVNNSCLLILVPELNPPRTVLLTILICPWSTTMNAFRHPLALHGLPNNMIENPWSWSIIGQWVQWGSKVWAEIHSSMLLPDSVFKWLCPHMARSCH